MWRRFAIDESVVALEPGVTLVIPPRASFQFRSFGEGMLVVLGVTMPPWPGPEEAELVDGWPAWSGRDSVDRTPGGR